MHGINLIKIRFHILIFSTAILVRLVFLLWGWLGQGLADESTLARVYAEQGYSLAAGYGYVRSSPGAGQEAITKLRREVVVNGFIAHPAYAEPLPTENITPEFLHPPGYPILFAALHRVLAIPAELPIRVVGLLLDSLAALLLFAIVRKFFSCRSGRVCRFALRCILTPGLLFHRLRFAYRFAEFFYAIGILYAAKCDGR
jgi:hypothetical protein